MAKSNVYVIRGELNWAKVIGEPKLNTFTEEREWSVDVTPDSNSRKTLESAGISNKLKTPKAGDSRSESFIAFRQKEYRVDPKTGERKKNEPVTITTVDGKDWGQTDLLGNGTMADVKFLVKEGGKYTGAYIQAIRVLRHVPFESQAFAPLSEDDEFFGASTEAEIADNTTAEPDTKGHSGNIDDLEDDIPF